jgi:Rrf2 family protein
MKINRSTGYALIAVGFIALNGSDRSVLAAEVSKEYNIPLEYLLKILQQLVRANILRSKRGPRGGFMLARDSKQITLLNIVEAVDGTLGGSMQLAQQGNNEAFCLKIEDIYRNATNSVKEIYSNARLSDILAE